MTTILLRIAYEGTHFSGWARQEGRRTVEDVVYGALAAVDAHVGPVRGMSRTDAGVHARSQLASVGVSLSIPPRGWVLAANSHLPDDVAVREARLVPDDFSPRFAVKSKTYRYRIHRDRVRDPLRAPFVWRIGDELDVGAMQRAADGLVGTHDFAAFRSASDERTNTVRTLTRVAVLEEARDELVVEVVGTAFLYNMVRIIVGTLVDVGAGRRPVETTTSALAERDRSRLGPTAPASGLCLHDAELSWPEGSSDPWPP